MNDKDIRLLASPDQSRPLPNDGRTPTPITGATLKQALPQNPPVDASAPSTPVGPRTFRMATTHL